MSSLEIIATVFAVLVLVKLLFLIVAPKAWIKASSAMLGKPLVATLIYLVLAVIVGCYVLANLAITQVAAVMLFTSLLVGIGLAPYSRVTLRIADEMVAEGLGKRGYRC